MSTAALNNLWAYLQGLSLSQGDREWLANKLIMPVKVQEDTAKDDSLSEFLKMEGIWSEDAEGEEYYQMMKHRNDGRPLAPDRHKTWTNPRQCSRYLQETYNNKTGKRPPLR